MSKTSDFLIVGAGIIGFALARELFQRYPGVSIRILEKENSAGCHASGRNSGILHAGFYYSEDSLKARFTRDGNRRLRDYCAEQKIPLNDCGKLVVAVEQNEVAKLEELFHRAKTNGIDAHLITALEAQELEPRIVTIDKALWSPTTASVDPREVMRALENELLRAGVLIEKSTSYHSGSSDNIETSRGKFSAGHLINAAGLYADRIAHSLGFGREYRVMPFKGLYLYANSTIGKLRCHIYPVPDLKNPFLGVHYTLAADGQIKIGPTAIPAFWREQYNGLDGFNLHEASEVMRSNFALFLGDRAGYLNLAVKEVRKYFKKYMIDQAARMAIDVNASMFSDWGPAGIRAQLLNIRNRSLVNDFVVEGDANSTHILNAVSPAFTCAFPFAEYVVNRIEINSGLARISHQRAR